jgi:adenylate cyclase
MPDIFISYSRKDSEKALSLAEKLRRDGMSVWIDQHGIEAAKSWSAEIVDAIEECKAFMVLISSNSLESENVSRELSLAFEEKRKLIPVLLEDVALTREFKYPLAGIQRVAYTQHDAITQALIGCGVVGFEERNTTGVDAGKPGIVVLPFADLSPTQDNGWFADGLLSELIEQLASSEFVRTIDRQTCLGLKGGKDSIPALAQRLQVRYFIDGSVRKFGEQIKISAQLLDAMEGEYLWTHSYKGEFTDVFEIQESVAQSVMEALHKSLGSSSERAEYTLKASLQTKIPEAYALFLKGQEQIQLSTKASLLKALEFFRASLSVDPAYDRAASLFAEVGLVCYLNYGSDRTLFDECVQILDRLERTLPSYWKTYAQRSKIALAQGDPQAALQYAIKSVECGPGYSGGYLALARAYNKLGNQDMEIQALENAIALHPSSLSNYDTLVLHCERAGQPERAKMWAQAALPWYQDALSANPNNETRIIYAHMLLTSGNLSQASEEIEQVRIDAENEPRQCYNIACLYSRLERFDDALDLLKLIKSSPRIVKLAIDDPDLDGLRGRPEFEDLLREVQRSN